MTEPLTIWQEIALKVYSDGSNDHITGYAYEDEYGDSLLSFVMAELSTNEDCENTETAIQRIESGIRDLQTVLEALSALSHSPPAADQEAQTP